VIRLLDAPLQLVADVARHGRNDALSFAERGLEFSGLAGANLKICDFKDHALGHARKKAAMKPMTNGKTINAGMSQPSVLKCLLILTALKRLTPRLTGGNAKH
jgi:hypothetical protein